MLTLKSPISIDRATLGAPRYFLPVVKHPRDWQITLGPLGYVEVTEKEAAKWCPVFVERERRNHETQNRLAT